MNISSSLQKYLESESFKTSENKFISPNDPRLPEIKNYFQTNVRKETKNQIKKATLSINMQRSTKSPCDYYDLPYCRKSFDFDQAPPKTFYDQENDAASSFIHLPLQNPQNQQDSAN